jgi:hypothetical protein
MKPVILHEIVVGYGEFLYRKSSQAEPDICSVSHGEVSSYVGYSKTMRIFQEFSAELSGFFVRFLSRHRNAFDFYCAIILATEL